MANRSTQAYHRGHAASLEISRQEAVQRRINEAEARLRGEQIDGFDKIDARFDGVDARFEAVEAKFEAMDSKLEAKFDKVENKINTFQMWMFGIVITMLIGFISLFFAVILT